MYKLFFLLIFILMTHSVLSQVVLKDDVKINKTKGTKTHKSSNKCINKEEVEIKTFRIDQGWGYDILINTKVYIHQTNIPAISGIHIFKTKKDALKIARLMKDKRCNNILPPTIAKKDIDDLLYNN